jgi:glycosyltransferase involved in cell wall biosynthesis
MNSTVNPTFSIITPSFNQGLFIEATIKSVLAQNYTAFEHIIVDGGSTDDTPDILSRYPHLKIIREPDRGQADAVNKGLRAARGDIIGWLNSDDTYYLGVFEAVAGTIDPANGVYIVMGHCAYIDEDGTATGREHPSAFTGHRRVVEIWKGYTIPQPAVFFHRKVYEQCGGLDESLYFALDYDLFLRYTRRFAIHPVDQLWATYRLHMSSKTTEISQAELLEKSLVVSRRYWGASSTLSYWRYLASYWMHGGRLGVLSLRRVNRAERAYQERRLAGFFGNLLLSFLWFPPTASRLLILPGIRMLFRSHRAQKPERGGI